MPSPHTVQSIVVAAGRRIAKLPLNYLHAGVSRITTAFALVVMTCMLMGSREAHAVLPIYLCTAPNVTPGSDCTAVTITDWEFRGYIAGNPFPGRYPSLAALIGAVQSAWLTHPYVCSFTPAGTQLDIGGSVAFGPDAIRYQNGTDVFHQHRVTFDEVIGNSSNPCWDQFQNILYVAQDRQIRCPVGYAQVYEKGPPAIGPYCARPWGNFDEAKCPSCGGKGKITKGNPVDIATGDKVQIATDRKSVV